MSTQANDAVERAEQLLDLRERYRRALTGTRTRSPEVVDLMLHAPILTTRLIA